MAPFEGQPLITRVDPASPARRAGLAPGDRLLALDGRPVGDIVDYRIAGADSTVTMVTSRSGRLRRIRITKSPSEPLGLHFDSPTIGPLIRCRNRCIFCFVDQNPSGLRPSLYLKDDDYRLSFFYGNFITLNHLTEKEMARILKLRLAPLYVSVHSTNPAVRRRLFRSPAASRGLEQLRRLCLAGLPVHAQAVLCPGYNDGPEVLRTIRDLAALGRSVLSLALVPVGLSAHRCPRCPELAQLQKAGAARLVDEIGALQKRFLAERGSRFVFLADEIYALAGAAYPAAEEYENFPQLENGIGPARLFLEELKQVASRLPAALPRPLTVTLITAVLAAPLLRRLVRVFSTVRGLKIRQVTAENRFFGATITTAGLLTGSDLTAALDDLPGDPGETVFIPATALKDGTALFLDDTTPADLAAWCGIPVRAVDGPVALLAAISALAAREPDGRGKRAAEREHCGHSRPPQRGQVNPV